LPVGAARLHAGARTLRRARRARHRVAAWCVPTRTVRMVTVLTGVVRARCVAPRSVPGGRRIDCRPVGRRICDRSSVRGCVFARAGAPAAVGVRAPALRARLRATRRVAAARESRRAGQQHAHDDARSPPHWPCPPVSSARAGGSPFVR
jgi:hypothetical protein